MHEFTVEGIRPSVRSTMHRGWVDDREVTIENLSYHTQSLLDMQGGERKCTTQEDHQ